MTRSKRSLVLAGMLAGFVLAGCSSKGDDDDDDGNSAGSGGTAAGSGGTTTGSGGASSGNAGMGAGSGGRAASQNGSGGASSGSGGSASGSGGATAPGDGGVNTADAGLDIHEVPFMATGEPITADDGKWTWIDFPDTKCRDGSMAGLAVSLKPGSKKLMIFLEGGGACFDSLTCLQNGLGFSDVANQKAEKTAGVFNRGEASNPVKDWNFVYVPYCTGDVHVGTNDNGMVSGVDGVQHFVGRLNMKAFLNRLVPTFPDAEQVLLTGSSAGGFGASANVEFVQWAFEGVPLTMIDDSGPPMSATYLPPCLQKQWRELWGFENSILSDCGADCPDHDNFEIDYAKHLAKKYPDAYGGLIETTADGTITTFYGYGQNDCMGSALTPVSGDDFKAGLLEYREIMKTTYPRFGTYYIEGTQHTWLEGASFFTENAGSKSLVQWYADIVNGVEATHEGP